MNAVTAWRDVGERIALARQASSFNQTDLAVRAGIERTALAKIEKGRRSVSALELARIAAALDRPLDWFVRDAPPTVVSRRAATGKVDDSRLDVEVDRAARDVELLLELGTLPPRPARSARALRSYDQAETLAAAVRGEIGVVEGPILGLATLAERVGLHTFSVAAGLDADDGAYVAVENTGVAVVNASAAPGRRRFTLAHELGHHLLGDAFAADTNLVGEAAGRERLVNAFAVHLLIPRAAVTNRWHQLHGDTDHRSAALVIAVEFRVSWTALCSHLRTIGLITHRQRELLVQRLPTRAEQMERGLEIVEELPPGYVPPLFAAAVMRAYRRRELGRSRTLELLRGSLNDSELPELADPEKDPDLRGSLEP